MPGMRYVCVISFGLLVVWLIGSCAPVPRKEGSPQRVGGAGADYVGLPLQQAQAAADRQGLRHRVVVRDGVSLPVTMDYRPDRLNFTVVRGVVTQVTKG